LVPQDRRATAPEIPSLKEKAASVRKARTPPAMRVALVLLPIAIIGGAGVAFLFKPPPPPIDPAPITPLARPSIAAAPSDVTVTLRSSPAGAEVLEDGVLVGKTPIERKWKRDETRSVTFQLAGYREVQK